MKRFILLLSFVALVMDAGARQTLYTDPELMPPGIMMLDSVAGKCERARAHLRVAVPRCTVEQTWSLIWNNAGENNFMEAQFVMPAADVYDDIYDTQPVVRVLKVADGVETVVSETKLKNNFGHGERPNSLRLIYDGYSARLYAGDGDGNYIGVVPYNPDVCVFAARFMDGARCSRITTEFELKPARERCCIGDVTELLDYLRGSSDATEGVWEYLDRNINEDSADLGGFYTLATVKNADGGLDLVYLGGASVNGSGWRSLDIKGRLFPTIFQNTYNLEWVEADGSRMAGEQDAQFSPDGSILTLRYPLYDAVLRFSRKTGL